MGDCRDGGAGINPITNMASEIMKRRLIADPATLDIRCVYGIKPEQIKYVYGIPILPVKSAERLREGDDTYFVITHAGMGALYNVLGEAVSSSTGETRYLVDLNERGIVHLQVTGSKGKGKGKGKGKSKSKRRVRFDETVTAFDGDTISRHTVRPIKDIDAHVVLRHNDLATQERQERHVAIYHVLMHGTEYEVDNMYT